MMPQSIVSTELMWCRPSGYVINYNVGTAENRRGGLITTLTQVVAHADGSV